MWRSLWRSIDRFSLHYFKYVINELRKINVLDKHNREVVADLLQSIVEIVTYGDSHDPSIFECFMEFQVLAEFVRLLNIAGNSGIEASLLQYLSIMIQNMDNEHAIYYCLSNGYINSIITHQFELDGGDLVPYYVSFLRAVSAKIDRDTICLLVKVHQDTVVSLPLYVEALKFAHHGEKMIQIAARAITLNIYNVADDMVYQYLTTPPVSEYFSDLVLHLRKKCVQVDALINGTKETWQERKRELIVQTDGIVDDLYYLKDIVCIGEHRLSTLVTHNLVNILILPILFPQLHVSQSNGTCLSAVTSLYVLSRLLQVFDGTDLANFVSSSLLFSFMPSQLDWASAFDIHYNETEEMVHLQPKWNDNFMRNHLLVHASGSIKFGSCFASLPLEIAQSKGGGILHYIFSSNHGLMLASLMLLFVSAETKVVDHQVEAMIDQIKIVDALLKVLSSEPPCSVSILLHTAWFLRKLLVFWNMKLDDREFDLFKTSYERSYGRLCEEFRGCWCDYIPDTLRNEWAKCKTALEGESSKSKDPFFVLDLAGNQISASSNTNTSSYCLCYSICYLPPSPSFSCLLVATSQNHDLTPAVQIPDTVGSTFDWQQMVDAVKVFIIHLQLKAFILGDGHIDNPFETLKKSYLPVSGKRYASDLSSASFGSEVALGLGIPCTIAFSEAGTRDIYVMPVAKEISGKLLLVEQHPLHSRRGVVIAIAPLAGLNPKIDENHPTWLHLQLREFEPRFDVSETRSLGSNTNVPAAQGRWILGFSSADYCMAAYSAILEEARRQRSFIENLVGRLLMKNSFWKLSDIQ